MTFPATVAPRLLNGRLALITGAGQGNGRALALGLAQAGARVVVTDMNADTVEETAQAVRAEGGEAWSFVLDVTSPAACKALAARVGAEIGKVDLLVNNAGIIIREGMSSPNAEANWKKTIDVNVNGTFNVTLCLAVGDQGDQGLDHQHRIHRRVRGPRRQPRLLAVQGRDQDVHAVAGGGARAARRARQRAGTRRDRDADDRGDTREPRAAASRS